MATDRDWVAEMHCLTVHPQHTGAGDQLGESQRAVGILRRAARALVMDDRLETRAAFDAIPRGNQACVLVDELAAAMPGGESDPPVRCAHPAQEYVLAYVQALRQASTAVYFCRRIQHPAGSCWFSVHGPAHDLCGRVLSTAHRLGDTNRLAVSAANTSKLNARVHGY